MSEVNIDNIEYLLNDNNDTAIVSGNTLDIETDLVISSINYNGKLYSVTSIRDHAFAGTPLGSVTIPNTVTSIGDYAFHGTPLESVTIPNSVTSIGNNAFQYTSLYSVVFEDNSTLETIGDYAFGHSRLGETGQQVTIPNSVKSIGNNAFQGTSLDSVVFEDNSTLETIGDYAFQGTSLDSVTIPNSVKSIGNNAFQGTPLESVTIPNSVTSIGNNAFQGTSLYSVVFEDNSTLKTIGDYAFGQSRLGQTGQQVTIPNSVTSIGNNAFQGTSLESVTIPNSVTSIGISAFQHTLLYSVVFQDNSTLETIGDFAFEGTPLESVTIPNSVKSIGNNAFQDTSLESVTIPNSVTSIGISAFQYTLLLYSVVFQDNSTLETIGDFAFEGTPLESVTIPNSVTSIGNNAFPNLINVVIVDQSKITVNTNSFKDVRSTSSSSITFNNTNGYNNLSITWKTISTYYATQIYPNSTIITPTITNFYPNGISLEKHYKTNLSFTLTDPSSNSDGTFSYTSSNTSVATIDRNIITVLTGGSSDITAMQDASGIYSDGSATTILLISNVCFLAGALVTTDQGIIAIEKINPNIHTIKGKKIVGITQTISSYDFLICFEKNALGNNIPSQKTYMTHGHEVLYKGKMKKAIEFIEVSDNIYKTKYRGQVLYNVLMDKHKIIEVNNLKCESLNPINPIAKLYKVLNNCSFEEQKKLARECNEYTIANNKFNKKQLQYFKRCL